MVTRQGFLHRHGVAPRLGPAGVASDLVVVVEEVRCRHHRGEHAQGEGGDGPPEGLGGGRRRGEGVRETGVGGRGGERQPTVEHEVTSWNFSLRVFARTDKFPNLSESSKLKILIQIGSIYNILFLGNTSRYLVFEKENLKPGYHFYIN